MIISSIFIGVSLHAQTNKRTPKSSQSKIVSKNQKSNFSSTEKDKRIQSQKKITIEIINNGDWDKFEENTFWRFVKINDRNFSQVLNTEGGILRISENTMNTQNWKDENGNFSFRSISEPFKISQEFTGSKNEKGQYRNTLIEKEIYETNAPISSFSFKIYTYPKNDNSNAKKELSKIINIYSENKLIQSFSYTYDELIKLGGISIDNLEVGNIKTK